MTTGQFREMLDVLAELQRKEGNLQLAEALLKLAEVFDGNEDRRLDNFVEEIRRLRRPIAA